MATGSKVPALPQTPDGVPSISLLADDDNAMATYNSVRRGRQAPPSVFLDTVKNAERGTLYKIVPTKVYTSVVIEKELKKAQKQLAKDNINVTVSVRRHDDAKPTPFVAWSVTDKEAPTASE